MKKLQLHKTSKGEFTLYVPELDETYHSRNGAISESQHVFIEKGLTPKKEYSELRVFELGFGTGLNALLAAIYAVKHKQLIHYHTIETFPLDVDTIASLNYGNYLNEEDANQLFELLHQAEWNVHRRISDYFTLHKQEVSMQEVVLQNKYYDIVFFDAFGPQKQAELWELEIFQKLKAGMRSDGILTTYSSAGHLKRKLSACGFSLEHPEGANGKREMTVAYLNSQDSH